MCRIIRPYLVFGVSLLILAATAGCEPQFEDDFCEEDDDCFPDEMCQDGRCVVDDDYIHDPNECGGEEELDGAVGDPCGPCNLDQLQCDEDDPNALVCDGETPCPEAISTTQPTNIEATSATFNGMIDEYPHDPIDDLGFCWGHDPEPSEEDADCASVDDIPTEEGEFSHDVDALIPGADYTVRAFAVSADERDYANDVEFTTAAPAPENVDTDGTVDSVTITWDEPEGAEGYRVYADDDEIADIDDSEETEFEHEDASAGTVTAPVDPEASDDLTDGIEITWDDADSVDGTEHDYTVVAVYRDTESAPSEEVGGNRLGPEATGYQLYIGDDDTPDEEDWIDLGDTNEYMHDDEEVPKAQILPEDAEASNGDYSNQITISTPEPDFEDADEVTYRLRSIYGEDDESNSEPSPQFEGQRGHDTSVDYQWQRSDDDDTFADLDGVTNREDVDDSDEILSGDTFYYRAQLDADGAETAFTPSDDGYVMDTDAGSVSQPDVTDITADSATFNSTVDDLGTPEASEHGFCYSTDTTPEYGDDDCLELGAPGSTGDPMEATASALEPGTSYHVRAFIHHDDAGTGYSTPAEFTTDAPEPDGLSVTETVDDITISWNEASGATGYRVYADHDGDGSFAVIDDIGDSSQTSTTDSDAPAGTALTPGDFEASNDDTEGVELTWTAPDTEPGATVDYEVVAEYADADSGPAVTSGQRSAPDITGYEVSIEGADWEWAGDDSATSFLDDQAPYATIETGETNASEGDYSDQITLETAAPTFQAAGDQSYQLRAVWGPNDEYSGNETGSETGQRAYDDDTTSYQWQRSDDDDTFADLDGVTNREDVDDSDEIQDGETYYYQAVISADGASDATTDSDEGWVTPAVELDAPDNLSASTDNTDAIELNWSDVDDADEYVVFRDGSEIATVSDTEYDDTDSALNEPDLPPAPASAWVDSSDASSVTIAWDEAEADRGDNEHTYTVRAQAGDEQSPDSDPADGALEAPSIDGYELAIGSGDWESVGSDTDYTDSDEAAPPEISFGTLTATDDHPDGIEVDIADFDEYPIEVADGESLTYRVRSVDTDNRTSADGEYADTEGSRTADNEDIDAQWEYDDGTWNLLTDEISYDDAQYLDENVAPGEERTYRVTADIDSIGDTAVESGTITGTAGDEEDNGDNGDNGDE